MANKNWTYVQAMHAVQAGVAMRLNFYPDSTKQVRVGITSAHVTDKAVADLLIAKGVFTKEEYLEQVRLTAIEEAESLERELSELTGKSIKLGTLY